MTDAPLIHVVDDDDSFRTAVARLLRASGYTVAVYPSAEEFLRTPPGKQPGCILLDVRMAGLGGLELQDRLAKLGCILPIVFLTGHGDIPTSVRAIKAGAEDFLPKPVSKATLLAAVERALVRDRQARKRQERLDGFRLLVSAFTPRESEVLPSSSAASSTSRSPSSWERRSEPSRRTATPSCRNSTFARLPRRSRSPSGSG
jgi:FixJ family two-component response regulator